MKPPSDGLTSIFARISPLLTARPCQPLAKLRRDIITVSLIVAGARVPLIQQLTGLSADRLRQLHNEINRRSSASGRVPTQPFLAGPGHSLRRAEATLFMRHWLTGTDGDSTVRMLVAYYGYHDQRRAYKLPGEPLAFERCQLVVACWRADDGAGVLDGDEFVPWVACRTCNQDTLAETLFAQCPWCAGTLDISARLRGRAGRKKR